MTPARSWVGRGRLDRILGATRRHLPGTRRAERAAVLDQTRTAVTEAISPLARLERALHPWVAYAIMPVFALANAGLPLSWAEVVDPISLDAGWLSAFDHRSEQVRTFAVHRISAVAAVRAD